MRVDLAQFCEDYDVAVVVVSRDRADVLAKATDRLIQGYHLFYSGEGYESHTYREATRTEVPRGIQGLSAVRNFVLDTLPNRVVVFFDDDVKMVYWVAGTRSVRLDTERVHLAIIDMVVHALDQGSEAFGMSPLDLRKSSPLVPFRLRGVFGTVIGVVGRDHRFDERNLLKVDYDFCLMTMAGNARIVHMDMRYFAASAKDELAGGNMAFRTQQRRHAEIDNLIRWWGPDVVIPSDNKGNEKLRVSVP
jgi:hypothetical protein